MKEKYICYGIVLFFIIETIYNLFSALLSMGISKFSVDANYILIGESLFYLLVLFLFFFKIEKFPQINIYAYIFILILYFIPKDVFYNLGIDELKKLSNIKLYREALKTLFIFIFALLAYIKYYQIKETGGTSK